MSGGAKNLVVTVSLSAVEAMKDHGICRWNYPIRCMQQKAKNNIRSFVEARRNHSSSGPSRLAESAVSRETRNAQMKKWEQNLEKVMGLSCWGPSTARF